MMDKEQKTYRDDKEGEEWNKIDEIKEKNKEELYVKTKFGLKSKAELTLTNTKFLESKRKREANERELDELTNQLDNELQQTTLNKGEIESHKNEIEERKKTIQDKEQKIHTLMKKTQELEKFKFVLDYKIKELKRDIGPREVEIQKLKEQTSKMEQEIIHFRKVNNNLLLIVDDLKLNQNGLQKEVANQIDKLEEQERYMKKFKDDVYDCMQYINQYKPLKQSIVRLHKKYVKEEIKFDQGEADPEKEYSNKRYYLEQSVDNERRVISKNSDTYRKGNNKMMKENVILLGVINGLRKEVIKLKLDARARGMMGAGLNSTIRSKYSEGGVSPAAIKELQVQDRIIEDLQAEMKAMKDHHDELGNRASSRAGRRLAPLPGTTIPLEDIEDGPGPEDSLLKPTLGEDEKRVEHEEGEGEESPTMQPKGHHEEGAQEIESPVKVQPTEEGAEPQAETSQNPIVVPEGNENPSIDEVVVPSPSAQPNVDEQPSGEQPSEVVEDKPATTEPAEPTEEPKAEEAPAEASEAPANDAPAEEAAPEESKD